MPRGGRGEGGGCLGTFGQGGGWGAGEETLQTTENNIEIGGTKVPAGTYSLYLQPGANGPAKVLVNKQTGQWGTKHDESQDFAKIELAKNPLSPAVNQFAIALEKDAKGMGGKLRLEWETTEYTAPITVEK